MAFLWLLLYGFINLLDFHGNEGFNSAIRIFSNTAIFSTFKSKRDKLNQEKLFFNQFSN